MAGSLRDDPDPINAAASSPPAPARVRAVLDGVRPGLIADGGNVEFVDIAEDGTVTVELQGACRRCPASQATLECVIEPRLRRALPGVSAVIAI